MVQAHSSQNMCNFAKVIFSWSVDIDLMNNSRNSPGHRLQYVSSVYYNDAQKVIYKSEKITFFNNKWKVDEKCLVRSYTYTTHIVSDFCFVY